MLISLDLETTLGKSEVQMPNTLPMKCSSYELI